MTGRRVYTPSRTDIAVLFLLAMAGLTGFAIWAALNGQWWTALGNVTAIAAIRFFPYGLK